MRQFFALGLLAAAWGMPVIAQTQPATVLSIGDGDTLRVREGSRTLNVRLACIDAPETSQEPHGASARAQLQALAPVGSAVDLRVKATDRYGRSVAELSRGGRNLNQAARADANELIVDGISRGRERPGWVLPHGRCPSRSQQRLRGRGRRAVWPLLTAYPFSSSYSCGLLNDLAREHS